MPIFSPLSLAPRLPRLPVSRRTVQAGTSNSYMITNRADPPYYGPLEPEYIVPLPGGNMWWYMSSTAVNDPLVNDYLSQSATPSTSPPSSFLTAIQSQLRQQANPQLTVFIHGLGTEWSDAINTTATLGANLQSVGYQGLVIGFDWPSYGEFYSALPDCYASGYPSVNTSGTIRDNINGSVGAFAHLCDFLTRLYSEVNGLTVSLVCHSEGNYMAMLGMAGRSNSPFYYILLLAADINNGAFQFPSSGLVGQAGSVAELSHNVTVYFCNNDNILAGSQFGYQDLGYHNPLYSARLGQTGPEYNQGAQWGNMYGVDCSAVISLQSVDNMENNGTIPPGVLLHSSYFYIPQVLQDIAATLGGTPAGSVTNRTAVANPNCFLMQPV